MILFIMDNKDFIKDGLDNDKIIEIIKKIRENHALVPIIVISGYDDIDKIRYSFSV